MRGTPGQIKVEGDAIGGDGGNYRDNTVDIRDGIISRVHKNGLSFVDRGDPTAYDFNVGDLVTDGLWHELDLSSIVSGAAKAILLKIVLLDDAAGSYIRFRKKGASNLITSPIVRTQVAEVSMDGEITVPCDSDGKLEYLTSVLTFTTLAIVVRGWWQ